VEEFAAAIAAAAVITGRPFAKEATGPPCTPFAICPTLGCTDVPVVDAAGAWCAMKLAAVCTDETISLGEGDHRACCCCCCVASDVFGIE
jgi:hypothetical protein